MTLRRLMTAVLVLSCACNEPLCAHRDGGQSVPDCKVEPSAPLCDEASKENVFFSYAEHVCSLLLDCFLMAFALPNLLRNLFGEGALSAAFIPRYVQMKDKDPAG